MKNVKRYAFLYTWPNSSFKNAEYECLKRIEIAAKNIGMPLDIISRNGYLLDDEYYETKERINEEDYEFMVSVHYDDIKFLDIFMYYTLWVPPEISMQYDFYNQIKKNIVFNDDFIVHDLGGMSGHLKTLLYDTGRTLNGASSLTAAPPASAALKPVLQDPHLFYCGINWEKLIGSTVRHSGLFDLFDNYSYINIFGPESTWRGCKRYMGKIPFDGVSILSEINRSGIVLALSSDAHYRAGSATNRIYEGCAGGAVIVSDTNPYIVEKFGDSVLYFDFDKSNPAKMFKQIADHVEWIRNHPEESRQLAERSQDIFLHEHAMEMQLQRLMDNHEKRKSVVAEALYSKDSKAKVLAVLIVDPVFFTQDEEKILVNTISNIEKQIEKNIQLVVGCDVAYYNKIKNIAEENGKNINVSVVSFNIYDQFGNKWKTRGQIMCQLVKRFSHEYLIMLSGNEGMFKDHISTLKRTLEENQSATIAYCGSIAENKSGEFDGFQFEILNYQRIYDGIFFTAHGMFLMRACVEKYVPEYVFDNIDGAELDLLVNMAVFKYKDDVVFSKRMTNRTKKYLTIKYNEIIKLPWQRNLIHGLIIWEYEGWKASDPANIGKILGDSLIGEQLVRMIRKYIKIEKEIKKIKLIFTLKKSRRAKIKKSIGVLELVKKMLP